MKVFISYPSNQRKLCEQLRLALEAEGHTAFVDRDELKEGEAYRASLRQAIEQSDGFIFFLTPKSVSPGSYTMTELDLAQRRWRRPSGHVLPVMVEPTPIDSIPPFLRAVTLLQPVSNVVGDTVAAVARMRRSPSVGAWATAAIALLFVVFAAGFFWRQHQLEGQSKRAEVTAAAQLCSSGNPAAGWDQFAQATERYPRDAQVRAAREDCGMLWLRQMRITQGKETFTDLVDQVQPVLARGLARTNGGQRAADLRAHLGWADFLRSRDSGPAANPIPQFQAALRDDADNVFAHAMWAHNLVWTRGRLSDEAKRHFDIATRSRRALPYVRELQFAAALSRQDQQPYAIVVANDMRVKGESADVDLRERLWRAVFERSLLTPQDRAPLLASLPGTTLLATFDWLFPASDVRPDRLATWRLCRAVLLVHAGDLRSARNDLEALRRELRAANEDGRIARTVDDLLERLRKEARRAAEKS